MRLPEPARVRDDTVGRVDWTVAVDSTIDRAHWHAAGARKRCPYCRGAGVPTTAQRPRSAPAPSPGGGRAP
ncbi:hypothetical protein [Streptomyces sp. CB01881]|uniref:hypothetical protein n=1 Tax=Streptomyces sp. CB01881 TaxID=2078691 RepID=UPI001F11D74D|nr:hypothetical protein [Streptomyces sp. CB01881]